MKNSFLVIGHAEGDSPVLRLFNNAASAIEASNAMELLIAKDNDVELSDIDDKVFIDQCESLESVLRDRLTSPELSSNKDATFLFVYHMEDDEPSLLPIAADTYENAQVIFEAFSQETKGTVHLDVSGSLDELTPLSC